MRAFPDQFVTLFTYTGSLAAENVVEALYVTQDEPLTPDNSLLLKYVLQIQMYLHVHVQQKFLKHGWNYAYKLHDHTVISTLLIQI